MKHILVPTDFSIFAEYAVEAALLFAKKWGATIHLYYSADIPDDWEDLPAAVRYHDAENRPLALKAREQLLALEQSIRAEGVPCTHHFTGGDFIANITEVTQKEDFDLVIMGSHGASGKKEWFLGSNTQKVVRKLDNKVLILKNPLPSIDFKEVLFVTGLSNDDKVALQHFLQFLEGFDIQKIHIMTVNTQSFFTQPSVLVKEVLKDFEAIAANSPVATHFYSDYSIDAGVRHFAEEFDIDLIAISNHVRQTFWRVFRGSNVEMLVNHSEKPVLTIDF